MKESRNILGWLGMAEGQSIMLDAEQHIVETCKTVASLSEAVKAFVAGDLSGKLAAIQKVKDGERDADKIVWKMINELSEGLLLPPDREDLLRYAKSLDRIADSTNKAARLLAFVEKKPSDTILKNLFVSAELIVQAADYLRQAIHAMGKNAIKEALGFCAEVERCEHEADDQKRLLIDAVLHERMEAGDLLVSYNLAEAMEQITDRIESASDMVKVMAVKSK